MKAPGETTPGVVGVRLSGAAADVALMARLLATAGGSMEVLAQSPPYPNRRDPGERVYLTVLLYAEGEQ